MRWAKASDDKNLQAGLASADEFLIAILERTCLTNPFIQSTISI